MGNGMNKVMPGLYVGNYRDSKDYQQLDRYQITHIVSIHDSPRRFHPDKHYLCVMAADTPDQNLSQYFSVCNDFIHAARLKDGNVLIHCLAGMSRSVTVAVAYIMSVTPLSWKEALKVVRAGRAIANPNLGFQNQLQEFECYKILEERKRLKERFPSLALECNDREQCFIALDNYEMLLENKGICEGQCKFAKDCPTATLIIDSYQCHLFPKQNQIKRHFHLQKRQPLDHMFQRICRSESRGGLRRKGSVASRKQYNLSSSPSTSTQLSVRSAAQSCPTSPRSSKSTSVGASAQLNNPRVAGEHAAEIDIGELSELKRSSSIVSTFRPRSSPAGLYSYTGSAPPSIHGSRVDLASGTGSAIYLGANSPSASQSPGVSRRVSLRSPKSTPKSTPDSSPKPSPKRAAPSKASTISHASSSSSNNSNSASPIKTAGSSKTNSKPPIAGSSHATKTPARTSPSLASLSSQQPPSKLAEKPTTKSTSNSSSCSKK